jgi:hypothetical protein
LVGFLSELHALRIDLFLHQQGLDTTTPAGKALFGFRGHRFLARRRDRQRIRRDLDLEQQLLQMGRLECGTRARAE